MPKIVITHDLGLSSDDIKRLELLGDLVIHDNRPSSGEDWLERAKGADIICSGISGLKDAYQELSDVYISLPMVGHSYLDGDILKKNNIRVSNSPGCNKDAVAEWVTGMIVNLLRDLMFYIGNDNLPKDKSSYTTLGLVDRRILIIGNGNVGTRVGEICEALKMKVSFFGKGDDLLEKIKDQVVVVNCLGANKTSNNLLDSNFFSAIKEGVYFVSIASNETYDKEAFFKSLDSGRIAGAAVDDGTMPAGLTSNPYYQRLLKHPKIIATPHIAYDSDYTDKLRNKMMIDNIEAWLKGEPVNLVS